MTTVSKIAVEYAARGAKGAQRADRNVRSSIRETAKTARSETGTINRWMERHQSAIRSIGMVTAAMMGAILAASPRMRAELAGVRTAFSLFADTVVDDVLPSTGTLSGAALSLAQAYRDLPDPIRRVISTLVAVIGFLAMATVAFKTLAFVFGPLIAGFKALIGVIGGAAAIKGALVVAAKLVTGAVAALAAAVGLPVAAVVALIAVVVALVAIFVTDFMGIRSAVVDVISDAGKALWGFLGTIGSALSSAASKAADFVTDFVAALIAAPGRVADIATDIAGSIVDEITDLVRRAAGWGRDIIDEFVGGIRDNIPSLDDVVDGAMDTISSTLSFDIARNDRMARRWGQDFMQEWATGAQQGTGNISQPVDDAHQQLAQPQPPQSARGGRGGGETTIIFERGAIVIESSGHIRRDGERVGREISDELGRFFDSHSSV